VTGTLYSLTKPLARPGKPGPEGTSWRLPWTSAHNRVVKRG